MEEQQPTKPTKTLLMTGIIAAFLFPFVCSYLLSGLPLNYQEKVFYSRFIYWSEAGLLWLYAHQLEKQDLLIWPEKVSGSRFILKWTVLLYLLCLAAGAVSAIPTWLGHKESMVIVKKIAAIVKNRPALIIFISCTAGVTEEVIFRGYILTRLSQLISNKYVPMVISSLFFSALHYKYDSLREYIFTFLVGMIMSWHYQKYGNIKPLILAHCIIDIIALSVMQRYVK